MVDAVKQSTFDVGRFMKKTGGPMVGIAERDLAKRAGSDWEEPKEKKKRKKKKKAAEAIKAAKAKEARIAPAGDEETSRRAAQRRRARSTISKGGRASTMLTGTGEDTLG